MLKTNLWNHRRAKGDRQCLAEIRERIVGTASIQVRDNQGPREVGENIGCQQRCWTSELGTPALSDVWT